MTPEAVKKKVEDLVWHARQEAIVLSFLWWQPINLSLITWLPVTTGREWTILPSLGLRAPHASCQPGSHHSLGTHLMGPTISWVVLVIPTLGCDPQPPVIDWPTLESTTREMERMVGHRNSGTRRSTTGRPTCHARPSETNRFSIQSFLGVYMTVVSSLSSCTT